MATDTTRETGSAGAVIPDEETMKGRTNCPFMRTALKAGLLRFDGRTAPIAAFGDVLGSKPNSIGQLARFFAWRNHRPPGMPKGRYDPLNLTGSRGDHPGDSQMLGVAGFNADRFAAFTANARTGPDGRPYMTARELGESIAKSLRRDPASRVGLFDVLFNNDMRNSAGEFGLLLEGFGHTLTDGPDRGQKALYVDDMRLLFERNVFPEAYRETVARASALGCIVISFGLLGFGGIYGHVRKAYARL